MCQISTPAAPKNWAPPRRRAWPPHRSAREGVASSSCSAEAAWRMVATVATSEATCPDAVGNSGAPESGETAPGTSSTCAITEQ
eukprot:3476590-Alexandrium_andersonii.AAC.1